MSDKTDPTKASLQLKAEGADLHGRAASSEQDHGRGKEGKKDESAPKAGLEFEGRRLPVDPEDMGEDELQLLTLQANAQYQGTVAWEFAKAEGPTDTEGVVKQFQGYTQELHSSKIAAHTKLKGLIGFEKPSPLLAILPDEARVQVLHGMGVYDNKDSKWHGHLVCFAGEVDGRDLLPPILVSKQKMSTCQRFLLAPVTYEAPELTLEDMTIVAHGLCREVGFAEDLEHVKPSRRAKKTAGTMAAPLLLPVPLAWAQVFLDSPSLAMAFERAELLGKSCSTSEEAEAVKPLLEYLSLGLVEHPQEKDSSVLASDWVAPDEETEDLEAWMQGKYEKRLELAASPLPPTSPKTTDDDDEEKKGDDEPGSSAAEELLKSLGIAGGAAEFLKQFAEFQEYKQKEAKSGQSGKPQSAPTSPVRKRPKSPVRKREKGKDAA